MAVCLDSARGGGAVLGEAAAVMSSYADKQADRITGLLDAGAPLHRTFLGNAQLLQTALYHVVWTITTITTSTHFQMLEKVCPCSPPPRPHFLFPNTPPPAGARHHVAVRPLQDVGGRRGRLPESEPEPRLRM